MGRRSVPPPGLEKRGSKVARIPLDSRPLITIETPDDMIRLKDKIPGAIVRLRLSWTNPTPGEIADIATMLRNKGAVMVRVEATRRSRVVVEKTKSVTPAGAGLRPMVIGMVNEANTKDREALWKVVDAALSAAGL